MKSFLALDFGATRIGAARASVEAKLAQPLPTIANDGSELDSIKEIVDEFSIDTIIVGWPRNLSGEETAQTEEVGQFCESLKQLELPIVKQDETLTSVQAKAELKSTRQKVTDKGMIDARAAVLILEDYLRSLG